MRSERGAHRSRRSRTSGRSGHRNAPAPSTQPSRQAASSSVRAAVAQRAPSQLIQRPVHPSNTAERNDAPPLDEMNFPGLPRPRNAPAPTPAQNQGLQESSDLFTPQQLMGIAGELLQDLRGCSSKRDQLQVLFNILCKYL
ncbi:hypothetical protein DMENIID0001_162870 [Sergentomyia squamirostris]